MSKTKERSSEYWICLDCAEKKRWIAPKRDVTVIMGLCGYCDRKDEVFLTPTVDFRKNTGGKILK